MFVGGLAGSVQVPVMECGGFPVLLSSEVRLPLGEGDVTSWECSLPFQTKPAGQSILLDPGGVCLRRGSFLE